jgi:HEAT repeat protein
MSRQLFKRLSGATAIVFAVWLGVAAAPAASLPALAHRSGMTYQNYAMPGCGTGRQLQDAAGELLFQMGQTNPQPFLAGLHNRDPEVRACCALVLGWHRTPGSFEPVLALTRDPDPRVRRCALGAVARYRAPRVIPVLIQALHAPDRRSQIIAYDGLRELGDPAALRAANAWYPTWVHRSD